MTNGSFKRAVELVENMQEDYAELPEIIAALKSEGLRPSELNEVLAELGYEV